MEDEQIAATVGRRLARRRAGEAGMDGSYSRK